MAKKTINKEKLKEEEKKMEKKAGGLWKEFKKFILRGNVVDMSIGVVIGGAFGAIVTALTNILLNICMWGVPGGLKGIFTILPGQKGGQWGVTISLSRYYELIKEQGVKDMINSQYTLHGNTYVYNGASIIDWGTFINAVITFFIIALTLFAIIKIFSKLQKARAEMRAKMLEEYYKKHPSERPVPVAPGLPEPTDHQLLKEIVSELKKQNASKTNKAKKK